jgi:SAM-dependent methyltransferase
MTDRDERTLSEQGHVADQYQDASKLDARRRLYQRYAQLGQTPFARWVFEAIEFPPAPRVLEVGCGSGDFWLENAARLPAGAQVIVSDSSAAMVESARAKLAPGRPEFSFQVLDVTEIPHADVAFDVVIANHMLYHVRERTRALRELRRVVRPSGAVYVTTNAWTHLLELRDVCERYCDIPSLLAARRLPDAFDVEEAARELQSIFATVHVRSRYTALEVSDPSHLVDYVRSMMRSDQAWDGARLRAHLEWRIGLEGSFRVTAAPALLIARAADR